jgi:type 2 lantibiotic biosynthesis protein LanM
MRSLTTNLNDAGLVFRFKVSNHPVAFIRCDAGVLYVRKRDYEAVSHALTRVYEEIGHSNLKQRVPAFTKRLAPGLGLAEDPPKGLDSFGLHRCRLLANALFQAHREGKKSIPDRLRVVEKHFEQNGISLETPFLNPASVDIYQFEFAETRTTPTCPSVPDSAERERQIHLEVAAQIGRTITKQAIWCEDRCNWLGFVPLDRSIVPLLQVAYTALGSELYSGTSGIALFLAELFAVTGDTEPRRAALGAIRQALSRVDDLPRPARAGFFIGWIGIAFVAARLGRLLQKEELLREASRLVRRCKRDLENGEFDLLYGKAGTIVGLLLLRDLLDEPSLLEYCIRLGRKLIATADKHDGTYSWNSSALWGSRNLTGFSHGCAGVGYALLELFRATRDAKYRKAAEAAFRYERSWCDSDLQNWPDLREEPGQPRPNLRALPFCNSWCHGAPGIALSRLRAYEILSDTECKAEAIAGLQTTAKGLEFRLSSGINNYSLCHGLAGNAEVLLYGERVLGSGTGEARAIVREVAAAGIELYHKGEKTWPCGTSGGENPSLMLGLAGIGYFYLRLSKLTVPQVLIFIPEEFNSLNA